MNFEELMSSLPLSEASFYMVLKVFAVVLLTLVLDFAQRKIASKLHNKLLKNGQKWDDAILGALIRPLSLLIWVVGLSLAVEMMDALTSNHIWLIRKVFLIYCLVWFLWRLFKNIEASLIQRYEQGDKDVADRTTIEALSKLIRLSLLITAVLITLQTLGISISGVLAFGGVGGIAVGFAARDLLANFFGGLMIYMDRPFAVGDWVRSPDREIEGTVEDIGWRLTRIRTFDKRPLYVPNSIFTNILVENPSRMSHRRIYETIGLRYDDLNKLPKIADEIKKMLIEHDEIDHTQTMIVNFNNFSESSVDFFIYTFTNTTNWIRFHEVKEDVLLKIAAIIESNNAEIAFPTTTIHVPDEVKFNNQTVSD